MQEHKFVFSMREATRYRFPTHINDLVMDRAEAETSEVFVVVLEPGEGPPLHVHHDTEQVFYVIEGAGILLIGAALEPHQINPGDVVRIPPHTLHRVQCSGAQPLRYLSVDCFVGAKPVAEPTWESHVRAMCAQNGWDFDEVRQGRHPDGM